MPVKKSAKTSDVKQAVAPKTMDIHPAGTAPTVTTARPVIVGNKSLATDPMLSANKAQDTTATSTEEVPSTGVTTAPVINHHSKTITPLSDSTTDDALTTENEAVAKSVEAITGSTKGVETATNSVASDEPDMPAGEPIKEQSTEEPSKEKPTEEVQQKLDETSSDGGEELESEQDPATPVDGDETAIQEKTAEQMREEQIEEYIQKKTYAVPIDKTGRRRHNAMLALLVVLVALVVALNFLLDLGVLTIPGAPSTDILSPKSL